MDFNSVIKFVQEHFTDGLVLVVGSGLSAAEGLPGMPALAEHLKASAGDLMGDDIALWAKIATSLNADNGLEAALLTYAPTESLEAWVVRRTCELLLPIENDIISAVVRGERTLRLTKFLARILKSPSGLPILTPNYDRLIEVACEMAQYHVDTTAIGTYADQDQNVVRRLMPDSMVGVLDGLPLLDTGEALLLGDAILLPARIKLKLPKIAPLSATRDFWKEWGEKSPDISAIAVAVETLRRQSRGGNGSFEKTTE